MNRKLILSFNNKKSKTNYAILIGLVFSLLITSIALNCNNYTSNTVKVNDSKEIEIEESKTLKKAGFLEIDPIEIYDDSDWATLASSYEWCSGSGKANDPYIIKDVAIDADEYDTGIYIVDTMVYFEIRNCTIYNANFAGIECIDIENGKFLNNSIYDNQEEGIYLSSSLNITISECIIENNIEWDGIWLDNCNNYTISNNIIRNNEYDGIYIDVNSYAILNTAGNIITLNRIYDNDNNGIGLYVSADSATTNYFTDNIISKNQIYDNGDDGIDFDIDVEDDNTKLYCENNTISNNNIYNNGVDDYGIGIIIEPYIYDNSYLSFQRNQIVKNNISYIEMEGIDIQMALSEYAGSLAKIKCGFNNISENRLEHIGWNGISLDGDTCVEDSIKAEGKLYIYNNTISSNVIKDFYGIGGIALYLDEESDNADVYFENNSIINNKITKESNGPDYYSPQAGIYIDRFNKTTISNNEMEKCGLLFSPYTNYTMLKSNNIENNNKVNGKQIQYKIDLEYLNPEEFGTPGQIILVNCNHTTISQLNVSEATTGILLYYCRNVTISKVNSSNGFGGFLLIYCNENNVSNNLANNNAYFGIALYYSNNNNITNNDFLGNKICILEINSYNNRKEDNKCPPSAVLPSGDDDDDDDDGKASAIPGYNLLILYIISLFTIIAISIKFIRIRNDI